MPRRRGSRENLPPVVGPDRRAPSRRVFLSCCLMGYRPPTGALDAPLPHPTQVGSRLALETRDRHLSPLLDTNDELRARLERLADLIGRGDVADPRSENRR